MLRFDTVRLQTVHVQIYLDNISHMDELKKRFSILFRNQNVEILVVTYEETSKFTRIH